MIIIFSKIKTFVYFTDKGIIKKRRRAYLVHFVQSSLRRKIIHSKNSLLDKFESRETADQRILRKLSRSQYHYKAQRSSHDPWVPTQKLPRLLTTSASAIRKIQRLGEIHDLDVDRQVKSRFFFCSCLNVKYSENSIYFFFVKTPNFFDFQMFLFRCQLAGRAGIWDPKFLLLLNCQCVLMWDLFYTLSYIVYSSYGYTFGVHFKGTFNTC